MTPQVDPNIVKPFARFAAVIVLFGIALLAVWLITIIDIIKSDFKNNSNKIVWFFFVTMLPPLGILLYCIIGRSQKNEEALEDVQYRRGTRYLDIGRD